MDRQRLMQNGTHAQEDGFRELHWRDESIGSSALNEDLMREPAWIGPTIGPEVVSEREAQRIAWNYFRSLPWQTMLARQSVMTVAEFVEHKFAPERIFAMRDAGRSHYQAMLKHVLRPETVDRLFHVANNKSRLKLKAIPDWPYLDNLLLHDARPDHIQRLTSAALTRGYSAQTVAHIRSVISAIFSHAKREKCFADENPASIVKLAKVTPKMASTLTIDQTKEVIAEMAYPEKEMTFFAVFTGMNVAEICGLQWKYVNLTGEEIDVDGVRIPPLSIGVRKQWYRGQLGSVAKNRVRNLPIPKPVLEILVILNAKTRYADPEDFVLVSRVGTPVNQTNIVKRRLKPISQKLQVPSLSWQVFLRTRKTLTSEFGIRFLDAAGVLLNPPVQNTCNIHSSWRCRAPQKLTQHRW